MTRTLILLGVLASACAVRSRDNTKASTRTLASEPDVQTSATGSAGLEHTREQDVFGYDAATRVLTAVSACFANADCSAESLSELSRLELLALDLDTKTIRRPVPGCTTSPTLVRGGFCGMMSQYDVDELRSSVAAGLNCVAKVHKEGAACAERRRGNTWLGRQTCSRELPGELRDMASNPPAERFAQDQPWAVQVSRVTTVAWAMCLEGVGNRVTGVAMAARWAAE